MTDRAPEQRVVDYLESNGYKPDAIIRYLEAMVEKEWAQSDFAECGPGEKMTFGVCRKIGEAPAAQPAQQQAAAPSQPQAQQPGQQQAKPKEPAKSPMEEKLEKAAKAQGSDPTNNRKVMIDGKAYGWAIQNGKPIMVEWGSVAGIKKAEGGKKGKKGRGGKPRSAKEEKKEQQPEQVRGRVQGLREALEKQATDAGRQAIQKQIDKLLKLI